MGGWRHDRREEEDEEEARTGFWGGGVRFDLLSAALSLTAANLSVAT